MSIAEKTVLVTGAGRGFGWGIAVALGGAGAKVAVTDINEADVERTVQEIQDTGATHSATDLMLPTKQPSNTWSGRRSSERAASKASSIAPSTCHWFPSRQRLKENGSVAGVVTTQIGFTVQWSLAYHLHVCSPHPVGVLLRPPGAGDVHLVRDDVLF